MVYVRRVQEGLAAARHGSSRCLGAEEAWALSGCSILTLFVSEGVGLDRPPAGEAFWSLLGGKEGWLRGLTRGLESPQRPREALSSYVTPQMWPYQRSS